jgi:hypothetical protein
MKNPIESKVLTDDVILRMAKELGIEVREKKEVIKVSSKDLENMERSGNFVKFSHKVWKLQKDGDNFYLERLEDEE